MNYINLLGIAGTTIILIFFILEQTHKVNADERSYDFFNFLGGSILVAYAYLIEAWPFVVLNTVWALISLKDLAKMKGGLHKKRAKDK